MYIYKYILNAEWKLLNKKKIQNDSICTEFKNRTIQYDLSDKLKGKSRKPLSQNTGEGDYHKGGEKDGDPEGTNGRPLRAGNVSFLDLSSGYTGVHFIVIL